jgi:hypothetical protein
MSFSFSKALKSKFRYPVYLIKITHADDSVSRLNTGYRNIDWDDGSGLQTWRGVSSVLSLDLPAQSGALEVVEFTLALNGLSSEFRWMASETVRGLPIVITLGFVGESGEILGYEVVEDGLQDRVTWSEDDQGEQVLSLICQGGVAFLLNQSTGRWSPEPHRDFLISQGIDPDTDTGFDRQAGIPDDDAEAAWWPPA